MNRPFVWGVRPSVVLLRITGSSDTARCRRLAGAGRTYSSMQADESHVFVPALHFRPQCRHDLGGFLGIGGQAPIEYQHLISGEHPACMQSFQSRAKPNTLPSLGKEVANQSALLLATALNSANPSRAKERQVSPAALGSAPQQMLRQERSGKGDDRRVSVVTGAAFPEGSRKSPHEVSGSRCGNCSTMWSLFRA